MYRYPGTELDLFSLAVNWKRYWITLVSPYISGRVLEVGTGTGNNTGLIQSMCRGKFTAWTCLEPDITLIDRLKQKIAFEKTGAVIEVVHGRVIDLPQTMPPYDTILYIDVLEHVKNDKTELQSAANLLSTNGHLIVLSPAHAFFYSEFDRRIGHFRRYTIGTLKRLTPQECIPVLCRYLDSAGMIVSLVNRILFHQSAFKPGHIMIWDRFFIPVSRVLDTLTFGKIGKSLLMVWRKPPLSGKNSIHEINPNTRATD